MDAHPAVELLKQHVEEIAQTVGDDLEGEVLEQLGEEYDALRALYRQAVGAGASVVKAAV
jgi:hypothetical protein